MGKKPKEETALAQYGAALAALAEQAVEQEKNTGGGQFFSLRGGTLKLGDNKLPNNEMGVIILDSVLENVYYQGDFDPEVVRPPMCYAFGRDEDTMSPHAECEKQFSPNCKECENNQWGSANKGRGKACRNRRRLALISGGVFDREGEFQEVDSPEDIQSANVAYLALPPTSINSFGSYVKQIFGTLKLPPLGVFTRVYLEDDAKTQFKVNFEMVGKVPDHLLGAVLDRHNAIKEEIAFPYQKGEAEELPKKKRSRKKRKY